MDFNVRDMELCEFEDIFRKIRQDFAPGEYAPYEVLYHQLKTGVQKGYILMNGEEEAAYSICAEGRSSMYVLISLFAVYREFRQSGIGSVFLDKLKKIYSGNKTIIAEVEKPEDAKTEKERGTRLKRMEFYRKAGFFQVPAIDYTIWHVPMHLMVLPPAADGIISSHEVGKALYEIYYSLMGDEYIHMFSFRALD